MNGPLLHSPIPQIKWNTLLLATLLFAFAEAGCQGRKNMGIGGAQLNRAANNSNSTGASNQSDHQDHFQHSYQDEHIDTDWILTTPESDLPELPLPYLTEAIQDQKQDIDFLKSELKDQQNIPSASPPDTEKKSASIQAKLKLSKQKYKYLIGKSLVALKKERVEFGKSLVDLNIKSENLNKEFLHQIQVIKNLSGKTQKPPIEDFQLETITTPIFPIKEDTESASSLWDIFKFDNETATQPPPPASNNGRFDQIRPQEDTQVEANILKQKTIKATSGKGAHAEELSASEKESTQFQKINQATLASNASLLKEQGALINNYKTTIDYLTRMSQPLKQGSDEKSEIQKEIRTLSQLQNKTEQDYNANLNKMIHLYQTSLTHLRRLADIEILPAQLVDELKSSVKKQASSLLHFASSLISEFKDRADSKPAKQALSDLVTHLVDDIGQQEDYRADISATQNSLHICETEDLPNCKINLHMIHQLEGHLLSPYEFANDAQGFGQFLAQSGVTSESLLNNISSFLDPAGTEHKKFAATCHAESKKDHPHPNLLPLQKYWIRGLVISLIVDRLNQFMTSQGQPTIKDVTSWFRSQCYNKKLNRSLNRSNTKRSPHISARAFDIRFLDHEHMLVGQQFFFDRIGAADQFGLRSILNTYPKLKFDDAIIMYHRTIHFAYGSPYGRRVSYGRPFNYLTCSHANTTQKAHCENKKQSRMDQDEAKFPRNQMLDWPKTYSRFPIDHHR